MTNDTPTSTRTESAPIVASSVTSTTARSTIYSDEVPTDTLLTTHETTLPSAPPATDLQPTINRLRSDCKECLAVIYRAREELTSDLPPHELTQAYVEVVQHTARLRTIRNQLYDVSNEIWNSIRPNYTSDTSCTRAVEMTDVGRMEKKIKNEIKSAEQIASALRMKRAQAEAELKDLI